MRFFPLASKAVGRHSFPLGIHEALSCRVFVIPSACLSLISSNLIEGPYTSMNSFQIQLEPRLQPLHPRDIIRTSEKGNPLRIPPPTGKDPLVPASSPANLDEALNWGISPIPKTMYFITFWGRCRYSYSRKTAPRPPVGRENSKIGTIFPTRLRSDSLIDLRTYIQGLF